MPFILLAALTPFFYYNQPNIAQSVIILAVAGLCSYRYFLDAQEKPDYLAIFQKEITNIKVHTTEKYDEVKGEVIVLREHIGKTKIAEQTAQQAVKGFRF